MTMTVAELRYLESVPTRLSKIGEQLERMNENIEKLIVLLTKV